MNTAFNNKRTDEILSSFDGIQPAEVPPFFYTRLKGRMQSEIPGKAPQVFFLRPAFLAVSLSLLLIMNIVFLAKRDNKKFPASNNSNAVNGIQSFAEAYGLNSSVVYE